MPTPNSKKRMSSDMPGNISPLELFELLENPLSKPFLIDVREKKELEIAQLPFSFLHLPLSESSEWAQGLENLLPNDRPLVVICHSGIRSLNFGIWLIKEDLDLEVLNLVGGIDAWSTDIDQSIPRY